MAAGALPKVVRVGIVGVGEVAQVIHIPVLQNLSHLYRITAICDVSEKALSYCSTRFHIPTKFTSVTDLIASPEVDIVFILSSDEFHAPVAIQAINAGKHVLIEKPMTTTLSSADAIIAAANSHPEVIVFVAYMRRYAGAFTEAAQIIKSFDKIVHARVRDVIGPNSAVIGQSGTFPQKFTDFPASAAAEREAAQDAVAKEVLGDDAADPMLRRWWRLLNALSSHDLSAMRELIGVPKEVLAVHTSPAGVNLQAIFEYDEFLCQFETGIDGLSRFDAFIEVTSPTKSIKIKYDTPYIRGLPIYLEITEMVNGELITTTRRPTYLDAYTAEMLELHAVLTAGAPVKTTPEDARLDLELFTKIMSHLKRESATRRAKVVPNGS